MYVYYTLATFSSSIVLMASGNSAFIASGAFALFLFLVYAGEVYFSYMNLTSRPTSFPPTFQAPTSADAPANPAYQMPSQPSSFEPATAPPPSVFAPPPYYPPDINTQATAAAMSSPPTTTTPPPPSQPTDTVDTTQTHDKSLYNTNPTYPSALNYPPKEVHAQSYF